MSLVLSNILAYNTLVKLWVDELRPAPNGWVWAKTITDAIRYLDHEDIEGVSIDYDISLLVAIGRKTPQEVHSSETFEPVARFIANAFEAGSFPIIIHSLNENGARILRNILSGWQIKIKPEPQADQDLISDERNVTGT